MTFLGWWKCLSSWLWHCFLETYTEIKGRQVICFKYGQYIIYLVVDQVSGMEDRKKKERKCGERGRTLYGLALPSARGSLGSRLGLGTIWLGRQLQAMQCGSWEPQRGATVFGLGEALQRRYRGCYNVSYWSLGLSLCQNILVAVVKHMAWNNLREGGSISLSVWEVPAHPSKEDIVARILYDCHIVPLLRSRERTEVGSTPRDLLPSAIPHLKAYLQQGIKRHIHSIPV